MNPDSYSFRDRDHERTFKSLFTDYYPSLVGFAVKYVRKETSAENIVQGVFLKLWENKESLHHIENIPAYLYQSVRNRCLNHIRNRKLREGGQSLDNLRDDISLDNDYIRHETYRHIHKAVETLPPSCKEIFKLTLSGFSAKEIALRMDISEETVKKQKQIARSKLREKLSSLY